MKKVWPLGQWIDSPARTERDDTTGRRFRVLTGGVGNNRHIYFNRANFTHDGRYAIILSDRTGRWQIYKFPALFCPTASDILHKCRYCRPDMTLS